jgi:hypothetical protein
VLEHRAQETTSEGSHHPQSGVGNSKTQEEEKTVNSEKSGFVCAASTKIGNRYRNQWINTGSEVKGKAAQKDSHKGQK